MTDTAEAVVLPDSEASVWGAGNHGLAVWVQHEWAERFEDPHHARIRTWAPDREVRDLARVEGLVCGLGVGAEKVVGLKGVDVNSGTGCNGGLTKARFFHMSREGGAMVESPFLAGKDWRVADASVTGDYMAVQISAAINVPYQQRWKILLVRLSDWTMRAFPVPEGRSISKSAVAVDEEHLYFSAENNMPGNHAFDRLYRYRLDHFDQIGEPFDPATAVPEEYR